MFLRVSLKPSLSNLSCSLLSTWGAVGRVRNPFNQALYLIVHLFDKRQGLFKICAFGSLLFTVVPKMAQVWNFSISGFLRSLDLFIV